MTFQLSLTDGGRWLQIKPTICNHITYYASVCYNDILAKVADGRKKKHCVLQNNLPIDKSLTIAIKFYSKSHNFAFVSLEWLSITTVTNLLFGSSHTTIV